jgi:hypothetical protein
MYTAKQYTRPLAVGDFCFPLLARSCIGKREYFINDCASPYRISCITFVAFSV